MIRVFVGYDPRVAAEFHVCVSSIIRHASKPVEIIPLALHLLEGYKELHMDGSNDFIYSRFLVPALCDYHGKAIFIDGDMVLTDDIAKLWDAPNSDMRKAVWVVQHDYRSQATRKYIGSPLESANEDYARKNWSSVMLWDCGNFLNRKLSPDYVAKASGSDLHRFAWLPEDRIGKLDPAWNWLDTEQPYNPDAKLIHYTLGAPGFEHYKMTDHSLSWHTEIHHMLRLDGEQPANMVKRSAEFAR